jgi:undecaprenyl-diphosphatase
VTSRAPIALDVAAGTLRGGAVPLAAFFTLLGRWYVLTVVAIAAAAVTVALRGDVRIIVLLFASQVLAQGVCSMIKELFHRMRPAAWLVHHEPDYSFPSGHSVTAIVFYLALTLLVLPLAALLAACVIGIPWSRLALDAHYATDVIGGLVFGCGWLCATIAIVGRVTMASRL